MTYTMHSVYRTYADNRESNTGENQRSKLKMKRRLKDIIILEVVRNFSPCHDKN